MRLERVVVFVPMAAVQACDDLAARYGSNRFRLAIAEGMPGAVQALEKLREIRMVEAVGRRRFALVAYPGDAGASRAGPPSQRSGSGSRRCGSSRTTAVRFAGLTRN